MILDETEEWETDCKLDSRQRYDMLYYLIHGAGYNHIRTSWEPVDHGHNA